MPTYQYACTACGEQLEAVQSFTDAPLTECPACGGALRKVFSAVGVVFKGSGFYKNDSRKSSTGDRSDAKAGSAASSDGGSGSGSGSDGAKTSSTNAGTSSDKPSPGKTSESAPASSSNSSKAPAAKTA